MRFCGNMDERNKRYNYFFPLFVFSLEEPGTSDNQGNRYSHFEKKGPD